MAVWDRGTTFEVNPPMGECLVRSNIEALFWRWQLAEGIAHVSAKNHEILRGQDSIKQSQSRLVDRIGICVVQDSELAGAGGAVASAPCLFVFVQFLHDIRPDEIEYGLVGVDRDRVPKHALAAVLVQLGEL